MQALRSTALAALLVVAHAAAARADATVFVGSARQPSGRLVKGAAIGAGILVVGVWAWSRPQSADGAAVDTAVLSGMLGDRRGILLAVLIPVLAVAVGLLVIWCLPTVAIAASPAAKCCVLRTNDA